jgi:hypothetical protein
MAFTMEQTFFAAIPVGIDLKYIGKAVIIISDHFLYEMVLPTNKDMYAQYDFPLHDKINLRLRYPGLISGILVGA